MEETLSPLDIHFFCYIEEVDESQSISVVVMCNRVRFYISVKSIDLRLAEALDTESDLEQKYRQLLKELPTRDEVDDDDPPRKSEKKLADWVMKACRPLFRELTSVDPVTQYHTLEEYINPTTHALKLVNDSGKLLAERCDIDPLITKEIHQIHRLQRSDLSTSSHAYVPAGAVELIDNTGKYYEIAAEKSSSLADPSTSSRDLA